MQFAKKTFDNGILFYNLSSWIQFLIGIFILATGVTLMVKADVGMFPWGVLQLGISVRFNIPFGFSIQSVGLLVIILAYLIGKVKPTTGTIANMILIGFFIDYIIYPAIPFYTVLWQKYLMMALSIIICAVGTSVYMSANLGAGPRDSLMMALYIRTGKSLRVVRSSLEVTVLIIGYLLGGKVGLGTLIFAISFGPVLQTCLKLLRLFPINLIKVDILNQPDTFFVKKVSQKTF